LIVIDIFEALFCAGWVPGGPPIGCRIDLRCDEGEEGNKEGKEKV
jgi:hypothetical protein